MRANELIALDTTHRYLTFASEQDQREWQRLLATNLTGGGMGLSGFGKARAIVLNYLGPSEGGNGGPIQAIGTPAAHPQNDESVNIYSQKLV